MFSTAAAKLVADALALSDEERAAVAEELLASLDPTAPDTPEAAAAFKVELDRRRAAYESGEEPGIPWPEARARLRARSTRP